MLCRYRRQFSQPVHRFYGFRRSHPDAWKITVLKSKEAPCLQAVDYFLWALLETRRLMAEIDTSIKQHGGWPLK